MSRIFISHSSADNEITRDILQRLEDAGFENVFLDHDARKGITAGVDWENELYRELRACQAMIVVCSKDTMSSNWCFAEITHAKSKGIEVFPIKIDDCTFYNILGSRHGIDWTLDAEDAWKRLQRGLLRAGIDPSNSFPWDSTRPPYCGLHSFEPEDAAIFFGREDEIQQGLQILNSQRRLGNTRSLLVLGPSGSGKSSLVKAGILPRMKRNEEDWIVLNVMRPHDDPLGGLEDTLRDAFQQIDPGGEPEIRLNDAAGLCNTLGKLIMKSNQRGARVLLIIDQAEELLSDRESETDTQQGAFFDLVIGALANDDCPLHTVWTLRTDFLPEFQRQLRSRELTSDKMHLELMDRRDLVQAIKRPAELIGVQLESGLAQKMIDDTHDGHALPLLSFTLSALYEAGHHDRLLDINEYEQIGGVAGALRGFAEEIFSSLDEQQQKGLAEIFLSMTRLEQNGRLSRRPIKRASIPPALIKVVDLFVDKHLLVAGGDDSGGTLEVAHEELFKAWDRLQNWLDEDRDYLLWNRRMDYAIQEWLQSDKSAKSLILGETLSEAERHLQKHPGDALDKQQEEFLDASRLAQLQLDKARRRNRQFINGLGVLLLGVIVIAGIQIVRTKQKTNQLFAADVTALADAQENPLVKGLLISSLAKYTPPAHAIQVAVNVAQKTVPLDIMADHTDNVTSLACSPDKKRVVSASSDATARVWTFDQAGKPITLEHQVKRLDGAIFSLNSRHVLTWASNGNVYLRLADGEGSPRLVASHEKGLVSAQFNPEDDRYMMTASSDGTVNIWNISAAASESGADSCLPITWEPGGEPGADQVAGVCKTHQLAGPGTAIKSASYSPDGKYIVAVTKGERVRLWGAQDFTEYTVPPFHAGEVMDAVFSPGDADHMSTYLVTTAKDHKAVLWKLNSLENGQSLTDPMVFAGHSNWVTSAQFSPNGKRLVTFSDDKNAIYWNVENNLNRVILSGHEERLTSSEFSTDNRFLATASNDDSVLVWDVASLEQALAGHAKALTAVSPDETTDSVEPMMVLAGHSDNITATSFCADNRYLVTASNDDTVQLWDLLRPVEPKVLVSRETPAADVDVNWDSSLVAVAFECPRPGDDPQLNKCDRALLLGTDGTVIKELGYAKSVDFIPEEKAKNGDYVLTVSKKDLANKQWSLVQEWPVSDGKPGSKAELAKGSFKSAIYGPQGNRFVTANLQGFAEIRSIDGEKLGCCDLHGRGTLYAEFSHDGDRVVTAMGRDKSAKVGEVPDPDSPSEQLPDSLGKHRLFVEMAVFSPDDQYIATASADETIRISKVDGSENERVFIGHTARVNSVAFSPDGKRLVSASEDGEARIWNTDRTGEAIRLKADGSAVLDAVFSPDGRRIITASKDGTVRVWRFLWQDLLEYLDDSTRVCLSVEQRVEYLQEKKDDEENGPAFENYNLCQQHKQNRANKTEG